MKDQLNTEKVSGLIFDAFKEENYITRDKMVPRVSSIIKAFRLNISAKNYNKSADKNQYAKLLRQLEIVEREAKLWKAKCKKKYSQEEIEGFYKEIDNIRNI